MPLVLADRVKDTTTTTGTGTITLSGTAPIGYVSFGTAIGNANTTYYTITAGSEWEVGLGTYTAAGLLLSRDTVLASSAGGTTKVTFSAGTKDVFVTYPAGKAIYEDGSDNVGIGTLTPGYKLDVAGDVRIAGGGGDLRIQSATGTTAFGGDSQIYNDANNMIFGTGTTTAERMRIDTAGQVGIGTSGPGYRLDVASGDTTAGLGYAMRLRSNATATAAAVQFTNSAASAQNGTIACTDAGVLTLQGDSATAALAFRTNGDERFRITSTGATTSSNLADAVGYKGLPQNSQTSAYTLALADMGKHISITTGGVVIPANGAVAFPIGSAISIFNNSSSSQTISITTDTLRLAGTATTGSRTLAQYGVATCLKVTSTVWVISGAGVS